MVGWFMSSSRLALEPVPERPFPNRLPPPDVARLVEIRPADLIKAIKATYP